MRRAFALAGLTVAFTVAYAPVAHAATTQTRTCPLPVVGGDPDSVQLSGPTVAGGRTWTVTADESPGEASHVVALAAIVSSDDGRTPGRGRTGRVVGGRDLQLRERRLGPLGRDLAEDDGHFRRALPAPSFPPGHGPRRRT
jgi:hypothetical protein